MLTDLYPVAPRLKYISTKPHIHSKYLPHSTLDTIDLNRFTNSNFLLNVLVVILCRTFDNNNSVYYIMKAYRSNIFKYQGQSLNQYAATNVPLTLF